MYSYRVTYTFTNGPTHAPNDPDGRWSGDGSGAFDVVDFPQEIHDTDAQRAELARTLDEHHAPRRHAVTGITAINRGQAGRFNERAHAGQFN